MYYNEKIFYFIIACFGYMWSDILYLGSKLILEHNGLFVFCETVFNDSTQ